MEFTAIPQTRKPVQITPLNETQRVYIQTIHRNDITFGIGRAGTGKTFLAAQVALKFMTEGLVRKIVICRPAIEAGGEKIGFLPGAINDKMDPYIRPIIDVFSKYWSMRTVKDYMAEGLIEIVPLAYMRGRTFEDIFIIADEMQNATSDQLLMLLTRLGKGRKMVITGDPIQSDVNGYSCFNTAHGILRNVQDIGFVRFHNRDVVRHPTVERILNVWPVSQIRVQHGAMAA